MDFPNRIRFVKQVVMSSRLLSALICVPVAIGCGVLIARVTPNPFAGQTDPYSSSIESSTRHRSSAGTASRPRITHSSTSDAIRAELPVARVIGTEDGPFGRPYDVLDLGERLVVLDQQPLASDGHQLLIIDKRTETIVASAGRRGQGPSELAYPNGLQADPADPTRFWVTDYMNGRMVLYDVDYTGAGGLDFVRITGSPFQAYWIADSLWTPGAFPYEILRRYEREGGDTTIAQEIGEPLYPNEPVEQAAEWNRNSIAVHPMGHTVVAGFAFDSRLQIYDVSGKLTHEIHGPILVEHDFDARTWAYVYTGATNDHILGLFAGISRQPRVSYATTKLHVFDWDGRLTHLLELGMDIVRFSVSADRRTIWGIRYDPFPLLVEFSPLPREGG